MSSRLQLLSLILVMAVMLPSLALGFAIVPRPNTTSRVPAVPGALATSSGMTLSDPKCIVNCNASTRPAGSSSHLEINVSHLGIPFIAFRVTVTNVDVNASQRLRFVIYGGTSGGLEFNTTYLNTSQINSQDVPPMSPNGTDNVTLVLTPLNTPDFVFVQSEWFYVGLFDILLQPATQDVVVISFPGQAAPTPPSAPRILQAGAGDRVVVLTWQTPASSGGSAITNYRVYRGTTSGAETMLTSLGPVLTLSDSGVMDGLSYYYQVSAINGVGEGPRSNEVQATPMAPTDTTPPTITITAPANNTVLTESTAIVSGTASDDFAIEKVELSADGATWVRATGSDSWSGTLTLAAGTDTISARATDTSGNARTSRVTVTVQLPGAAPLGLAPLLLAGTVLVVIAAALSVAFVLWRRRMNPGEPPPDRPT